MAVLSGANEIMLAVSECARRTHDLRERMESDFSLWRLDPFQLGKTQGDYSDVTSNAPAAPRHTTSRYTRCAARCRQVSATAAVIS